MPTDLRVGAIAHCYSTLYITEKQEFNCVAQSLAYSPLSFHAAANMLVYYSNGLCGVLPLLKLSGGICCHILLSLHYITG